MNGEVPDGPEKLSIMMEPWVPHIKKGHFYVNEASERCTLRGGPFVSPINLPRLPYCRGVDSFFNPGGLAVV